MFKSIRKIFGHTSDHSQNRASEFRLKSDCHSHILPGVDDGVPTLEKSLEILQRMEQAGWRELWLTPHIMEDIPNATDALRQRFEELTAAYPGGINLRLGAEYMLDTLFEERLENRDLLPLNGNHLLVETSYFDAPGNFMEIIERIIEAGYTPMLAHPERYNYIPGIDGYRPLLDMGVKFQLNAMSITGHYGPIAKKKAMALLHEKAYSAIGSDIHRAGHLDIILKSYPAIEKVWQN